MVVAADSSPDMRRGPEAGARRLGDISLCHRRRGRGEKGATSSSTDEGQLPPDAFDAANARKPVCQLASPAVLRMPDGEHGFEQGNVEEGFAKADRILEFKARRTVAHLGRAGAAEAITRWNGGLSGIMGQTPARLRA